MTHATGPAARAPLRDLARPLLAGTRGSPLALIQARDFLDRVLDALQVAHIEFDSDCAAAQRLHLLRKGS